MSECNSIESAYLTYYQRNQDVILNRAKDCYENDKARLRGQDRDTETYLKKKKIKRENMGRIDIATCLKKKKQRLKEYQKDYREAKRSQHNNKTFF